MLCQGQQIKIGKGKRMVACKKGFLTVICILACFKATASYFDCGYGSDPFAMEIDEGQTLSLSYSSRDQSIRVITKEGQNPEELVETVKDRITEYWEDRYWKSDVSGTPPHSLFIPSTQIKLMDPNRDWYFRTTAFDPSGGILVLQYKKGNPLSAKSWLLDTNPKGKTEYTHFGFASPGQEQEIESTFCAVDGGKIQIGNSILYAPNSMPLYLQAKRFNFEDFCICYRPDISELEPQRIMICPNRNKETSIHSIEIYPRQTPLILNGNPFEGVWKFSIIGAESVAVEFKKDEEDFTELAYRAVNGQKELVVRGSQGEGVWLLNSEPMSIFDPDINRYGLNED